MKNDVIDKISIYNDILKDIKPLKEIRKEKLNNIINEIDALKKV